MTMSMLSTAFDVVLAGLLAVMIFYAICLNKRILSLRERESEMQEMITQFNHSSAAAHASASALKTAGTEAEFGVKAAMAKGIALQNDLELMIDRAEALAGRLDGQLTRHARQERSSQIRRDPPAPDRDGMPPRRPVAFGDDGAPTDAGNRKAGFGTAADDEGFGMPRVAGAARDGETAPPASPATVRPFTPPARPRSEAINAAPATGPDAGVNEIKPRTDAERQLLEAIRAAKEGAV